MAAGLLPSEPALSPEPGWVQEAVCWPAGLFPGLSWACAALDPKLFFSIPDDDTLVLSVNYHISVHIICKSIDMWWVLILCLEKQNKTKPWSDKSNTFLLLALEMNMPLYRLKGCVIQES